MSLEELEAVRLVDLLELEQEEAAFYMGISRKAFWNDLVSSRKKIAAALVYGTGIVIEGGSYILREKYEAASPEQFKQAAGGLEMDLLEKELQLLETRLNHISAKMAAMKSGSADVKS